MSEWKYRIKSAAQLIADPEVATTASEIIMPEDNRPECTGLLDHLGRPLYRTSGRIPIGFRGKSSG